MPARMLERLALRGYTSFRALDLDLSDINVLIGANGAGKSNFINLFRLLNSMMNEELQIHVARAGGADQILHYGRKVTKQLEIELWFKGESNYANGYRARLLPVEDRLELTHESIYFHDRATYNQPYEAQTYTGSAKESRLPVWARQHRSVAWYVYDAMCSWQIYHFHDTSEAARVKQMGDILENRYLLPDAGNLAAYLYLLREQYPQHYRTIIETVRLTAPFFGDFILRPHPFNPAKIRLEWRERGSDLTFGANALSDGTLRFICLATLFLQPVEKLPATIILDEPELGLHPYAITLLAEMIQSVAEHAQVIVATQSVTLVDQFTPSDILVVDRTDGLSTIRRLERAEIDHWLQEYSLGELWVKNVLGGRP